jgi:hypothetical protein
MANKPKLKPGWRHYLLDALRREAFTILAEKGFTQMTMEDNICIDFHRISVDRVQCITFQFDKFGLPAFKVLIAEGPLDGLSQYGSKFVRGSELRTYQCRGEKAILRPGNKQFILVKIGLLSWFTMRLAILVGPEKAALQCVRRMVSLIPECEAWWESKAYGPHLFRDKTSELLQSILEKKHGKLS